MLLFLCGMEFFTIADSLENTTKEDETIYLLGIWKHLTVSSNKGARCLYEGENKEAEIEEESEEVDVFEEASKEDDVFEEASEEE